MAYNKIEGVPSYQEQKIKQLSSQVVELQSIIMQLRSQLTEKSTTIDQLNSENTQLKSYIEKMQQKSNLLNSNVQNINSIQVPNLESNIMLKPPQITVQKPAISESLSGKKRQCPKCGAMGFDIKEFDDKTKIISYVPRRIYAKKRVCIKCRFEF